MNDFGAGFAIGIAVGVGLGLAVGKKQQKPWSELTDREKKVRIAIIAVKVAVVAGFVALLLSM